MRVCVLSSFSFSFLLIFALLVFSFLYCFLCAQSPPPLFLLPFVTGECVPVYLRRSCVRNGDPEQRSPLSPQDHSCDGHFMIVCFFFLLHLCLTLSSSYGLYLRLCACDLPLCMPGALEVRRVFFQFLSSFSFWWPTYAVAQRSLPTFSLSMYITNTIDSFFFFSPFSSLKQHTRNLPSRPFTPFFFLCVYMCEFSAGLHAPHRRRFLQHDCTQFPSLNLHEMRKEITCLTSPSVLTDPPAHKPTATMSCVLTNTRRRRDFSTKKKRRNTEKQKLLFYFSSLPFPLFALKHNKEGEGERGCGRCSLLSLSLSC